jgi:hypothetical protein
MLLECGVVDEDVQPAEMAHGVFDDGGARVGVREVRGQKEDVTSGVHNRLADLFGVIDLGGKMRQRDGCAFAREQQCDGAPDARVAAGDERNLAVELARGLVVGRFEVRPRPQRRFTARLLLMLRRKRRLGLTAWHGPTSAVTRCKRKTTARATRMLTMTRACDVRCRSSAGATAS